MTFDKQEHKDMVLALLQQSNVPIPQAKLAAELLQCVETASVQVPTKSQPK